MINKKITYVDLLIGILLTIAAFIVKEEYYSNILLTAGLIMTVMSIINIIKMRYYAKPQNQAAYNEKLKKIHINTVDERKIFLRYKAGYTSYCIMTFLLLILAFIMAIVKTEPWVIAIIFGLFIIQYLTGIISMHYWGKRL